MNTDSTLSITPKQAANELRATKLLGLMFEDPTRTQQELCDLLGISSRNTLVAIIRSDIFQRQASQLLGGLKTQITAQLADGVPDVLAYQLDVGSGKLGEQVRDHVGAGRVVREFLSLLMEYSSDDDEVHREPVLQRNTFYEYIREDDGSIIEGKAEFDEEKIKAGYTMIVPSHNR